ncbi:MAG: MFS transporter [Mycolicibacterium sp.]|uniref:MFS transporter n=1 Tax=Mycolicibacterium sp. TaxID=2320850 RepID=UPI003D1160E4
MIRSRPRSGYELLRQRQFQQLWFANLISGFGLVMLMLASGWAMVTMTSSPLLVASVQMAVSVPAFVLGIPLGIMTDRFGHRRLLLFAQFAMLIPECGLALIAWQGLLTPWLLLAALVVIGVGLVIHGAAWKPLLCAMYPGEQLVAAISLNSLGTKSGKVVAPALGGYLTGVAGIALILALRVIAHLTVIRAVWQVPSHFHSESEEPGFAATPRNAFAEGWRFLRRSPEVYGPMIRCAMLMAPFAGLLALLPLDAKENIQTDALGYGGLLTALGIGTVASMSLMPRLRRHLPMNSMATMALAVFGLALLGVSRWDSMFLDAFFLLVLGFAWNIVSISHQVAVQTATPDAMRGLMTAFHEVSQQGSMIAGSFVFAVVAEHTVVSTGILVAGFVALGGLLLVRRYPLLDGIPETNGDNR